MNIAVKSNWSRKRFTPYGFPPLHDRFDPFRRRIVFVGADQHRNLLVAVEQISQQILTEESGGARDQHVTQ
jgi:hypothetical protein